MKKNKKNPVAKAIAKSKKNNKKQASMKKSQLKKIKPTKGVHKLKTGSKKLLKPLKVKLSKTKIPKTKVPKANVSKKGMVKTKTTKQNTLVKTNQKAPVPVIKKQQKEIKTGKPSPNMVQVKTPVKPNEIITASKGRNEFKTMQSTIAPQGTKTVEPVKSVPEEKNKIQKPVEITTKSTNGTKSAPVDDLQVYSSEELKEFETIILEKLDYARKELKNIKDSLSRRSDSGTDDTAVSAKMLEDGAETAQKENQNQLAARMQKFISNLEGALGRIKNGTYGRCIYTGKLIPKERLKAVPHTNYSIEGKAMQQQKQLSQTTELDFPPQEFMPDVPQE